MKRHPDEFQLALYAGADLGWLDSLRIRLHTGSCEACRAKVRSFAASISGLAELKGAEEIPVPGWEKLAAEMHANIRVGLAAGECVAPAYGGRWLALETLAAYACVLLVVAAGIWIQRPVPQTRTESGSAAVFGATESGIQLTEGNRTFGLLHRGARASEVAVSVSAQGAVGARYVDQTTGYVMVHHVVSVE